MTEIDSSSWVRRHAHFFLMVHVYRLEIPIDKMNNETSQNDIPHGENDTIEPIQIGNRPADLHITAGQQIEHDQGVVPGNGLAYIGSWVADNDIVVVPDDLLQGSNVPVSRIQDLKGFLGLDNNTNGIPNPPPALNRYIHDQKTPPINEKLAAKLCSCPSFHNA
jgi:hypothetical protein